MTKRNAFTLAEVLITLGIIGVVAAMTMPSLLNSTQGAQYRTAFKKALTVMSQAVVMNIALDDYDLSQIPEDETPIDLFKRRLNVASNVKMTIKSGEITIPSDKVLVLNDGIAIGFCNGHNDCTSGEEGSNGDDEDDGAASEGNGNSISCTKTNPCYAIIDTNGNKNPNKMVSCDSGTSGGTCKVTIPTDVYPVRMYEQTVEPYGVPARIVATMGK